MSACGVALLLACAGVAVGVGVWLCWEVLG